MRSITCMSHEQSSEEDRGGKSANIAVGAAREEQVGVKRRPILRKHPPPLAPCHHQEANLELDSAAIKRKKMGNQNQNGC